MNRHNKHRYLLVILFYVGFSSMIFSQSFLNPNSFTSLGTFNSSGNVTINMNTGQMSGGATFTGVVSGGILVFTFANFTLNSGHSITFTNVSDLGNKVAFLSQGDMTISGTVNANGGIGATQNSGPGGGFGGQGGTGGPNGHAGSGSGAATGTDGGGGAGFGGTGGTSNNSIGGTTYNSNFSSGISGGSGGTGSNFGNSGALWGGGGGGGVEFGALGTLTINSTASITANGGNGATSSSGAQDGQGGGSGGGIFIHSFNVTLQSGATITANGGNGGGGDNSLSFDDGGGGGGRVYIAAHTSGTLTNNGATISVSGGAAGVGAGINGNAGNTGTSTITQVTNNALPVELISFSALTQLNGSIKLDWSTATEVNNYGFDVERSSSSRLPDGQVLGTSWEKIGFVEGSGNSNSAKSYTFTDNLNLTAGNYLYRLKQIDNDGQFEYSKIVDVSYNTPAEFSLEQNYPNPFNPVTTISYSLPEKTQVSLIVFDVLGREVETLVNKEQENGIYNVQFDASSLNSGIYFYELKAGNFSEIKKLVLVK